jgi:hypothetical protein
MMSETVRLSLAIGRKGWSISSALSLSEFQLKRMHKGSPARPHAAACTAYSLSLSEALPRDPFNDSFPPAKRFDPAVQVQYTLNQPVIPPQGLGL